MDTVKERVTPAESTMSEEEREHRRLMSERMRALLAGEEEIVPAQNTAPVGVYEYEETFRSDHVPAYQQANPTEKLHAPVVPNSPDAPSAARRMADYVPVTVGMQQIRRFGDMPTASVRDYAPAAPVAPAAPAEETARPAQKKAGLFETLLYKNGELLDTAAPAIEATAYAPAREGVREPSFRSSFAEPEEETYEEPAAAEDEDAMPTPRTMALQNVAEEQNSKLLSALSMKTKLVLAAIAAVVVLLLAVVCVNTAIINSLKAGVSDREEQLADLTRTMEGIDDELTRLTSPEYVEEWALSHGMSK